MIAGQRSGAVTVDLAANSSLAGGVCSTGGVGRARLRTLQELVIDHENDIPDIHDSISIGIRCGSTRRLVSSTEEVSNQEDRIREIQASVIIGIATDECRRIDEADVARF